MPQSIRAHAAQAARLGTAVAESPRKLKSGDNDSSNSRRGLRAGQRPMRQQQPGGRRKFEPRRSAQQSAASAAACLPNRRHGLRRYKPRRRELRHSACRGYGCGGMCRIQLCGYLLLLLLPCVRPQPQAPQQPASDCGCSFNEWKEDLTELFGCTKPSTAERIFCFVHSVVSFNLKLKAYLAEFRRCVAFRKKTPDTCRQYCHCSSTCCTSAAFANFSSGFSTVTAHSKELYTNYKGIQRLSGFMKHVGAVNLLRGIFVDFINELTKKGFVNEKDSVFYRSHFKNDILAAAREMLNYTVQTDNASQCIVASMADYYNCDTAKIVPFYLGVYGAVLQQLLMQELYKELQGDTESEDKTQLEDLHQLQLYIQLAKGMVQQVIFCSTKEIYSIRTEEMKEKDLAMRNAGIVFSSFLLVLVIIVALLAVLSCRSKAAAQQVTVREEPAASTQANSDNGDLLYKRYYETEETL